MKRVFLLLLALVAMTQVVAVQPPRFVILPAVADDQYCVEACSKTTAALTSWNLPLYDGDDGYDYAIMVDSKVTPMGLMNSATTVLSLVKADGTTMFSTESTSSPMRDPAMAVSMSVDSQLDQFVNRFISTAE